METPQVWLEEIVRSLHALETPRDVSKMGAGELEDLLQDYEDQLWPEVVRLAENDTTFRHALAAVWAYQSPRFPDRVALLTGLGTFRKVHVEFIIFSSADEDDGGGSGWGDLVVEGNVSHMQLSAVLRRIANRLESRTDVP